MYPVSNAFLEAVKANTRKYYWTGRITTTAGTVYEFDQDDMVKGSGYITSQCCGSTEIELGTVYAAEMGISLFSEINRYTLEDAKVELFYHLQVAGGSYERIPMGIFEVSEANRKAKCLEIKAYDYMVRFEKAFTSLESIGNAYDFMVSHHRTWQVAILLNHVVAYIQRLTAAYLVFRIRYWRVTHLIPDSLIVEKGQCLLRSHHLGLPRVFSFSQNVCFHFFFRF